MHSVVVVQLSDFHLFADKQGCLKGINTYNSLLAVLKDASMRYPQASAYIFTGDLSQDGTAESYQHLKDLVAEFISRPCFVIAGNHDHLENMRHYLVSDSIHLKSFVDFANWRALFINTQVLNEEHGFIDGAEMETMKMNVSDRIENLLICMHHPPVMLNGFIDQSRLRNSSEFFNTLERMCGQKAVIFGHAHQEYFEQRENVVLMGTPSTCVQFKPHTSVCIKDVCSPGYRVLTLQQNGDVGTEVARL